MILPPTFEHRLQRLLDNARRSQWTVSEAVDWDLPLAPKAKVPRSVLVRVVSQLHHGELATAGICRNLIALLDQPLAQDCLAIQIGDETRHASVYLRYLEQLGDLAPPEAAFAEALDDGLAWPGSPCGTLLAYHVVLEGEALNIQNELTEEVDCPLLNAINRLASPDEARHVAFGRLYLEHHLPRLDREEREAIFRWIAGIWQNAARSTLLGLGVYRFLLRSKVEGHLARAWQRHLLSFERMGLVSRQDAQVLIPRCDDLGLKASA